MSHKNLKINDVSKDTEKLTTVKVEDLMPLPIDLDDKEWDEIPEETREEYACILDDTLILPIPKPKNKEEEDELVRKFLNGMEKLFTKENNWTFLTLLEITMEHCAKCNTCSDSCHLYEAPG